MKGTRLAWIVFTAAAASVSAVVNRREQSALRQTQAIVVERKKHLVLTRLQDENRHLRAAQLSDEERKSLEINRAEARRLRARLIELGSAESAAEPVEGGGPRELQARDWTYAGRANPKAVIESVLWAASRSDVERLSGLLGFAPEVRAKMEAMFSQLPAASREEYGSPEKVVATLLAANFPKDASSMTLLEDHLWGEDAAVSVTVGHSEGNPRTNLYRFHRADDGWQLMVPASVASGYARILTGEKQPSETAAH
jgi:hypothetical protein